MTEILIDRTGQPEVIAAPATGSRAVHIEAVEDQAAAAARNLATRAFCCRPHRFYRAFNNLRYSPVSREVVGIAAFRKPDVPSAEMN
jgi:hypothetical protein